MKTKINQTHIVSDYEYGQPTKEKKGFGDFHHLPERIMKQKMHQEFKNQEIN